jgi:hypothetical protein
MPFYFHAVCFLSPSRAYVEEADNYHHTNDTYYNIHPWATLRLDRIFAIYSGVVSGPHLVDAGAATNAAGTAAVAAFFTLG